MSKWIKKGDKVLVIAGNEKGRVGDIVSRKGDRVIVQGINVRKKCVKREKKAPGAGIIDIECPIHISNVSLCNVDGAPIKVKVRLEANGRKELYYLEGEKEVVFREIQKKRA